MYNGVLHIKGDGGSFPRFFFALSEKSSRGDEAVTPLMSDSVSASHFHFLWISDEVVSPLKEIPKLGTLMISKDD